MRNLVANDFFGAVDELLNLPVRYQRASAPVGQIRVDVKEQEDKYTLNADLPGVKKEDVKVKFENGQLTIAVSTQTQTEQKEGEKVHRLERFSSLRSRSFYFGDNVNDAEIKASYLDGVLNLEIPKHQPSVQVREINVQ
jgi:HSP20 family protein